MKFFTNKSIWSKIIIVLVVVILMEFIIAKPSFGIVGDIIVAGGGKLLQPVMSLVVVLADAIQSTIQSTIMGASECLIEIETVDSSWWKWGKWVLFGALFVGIAVATVIIPGATAAVAAVGAKAIITAWAGVAWAGAKALAVAAIMTIGTVWLTDEVAAAGTYVSAEYLPDKLYLPAYVISPEEIFKGNILLFNVNFFRDGIKIEKATSEDEDGNEVIQYYYYQDEDGKEIATSSQDTGQDLSRTISSWYVTLRYIGMVIMMVVLVYIGIRMLLSTVASDKAKYKQMIQDWFMGMIILFSMHYIMVFANEMVDSLTKIVVSSVDSKQYIIYMRDREDHKVIQYFKDNGLEELVSEDGEIEYPTNLMGMMRILLQLNKAGGTRYLGYAMCFVILVLLELFFIFTYLKRVIYMAFLTLMAPLVAVTYPIDKLNDGSAQGFNKWFKEYIFNLLIQPLHLLLYFILVTSAFDLAGNNIIYSICAIAFMIPAEKLLRSLFGFEKASTAPNALAGAAVTTGIMQLMKPKPPKGKQAQSSKGGAASNDEAKINLKRSTSFDTATQLGNTALGKDSSSSQTREQNTREQNTAEQNTAEQNSGIQDTGAQNPGIQDTGVQNPGIQDTEGLDTRVSDTGVPDTGVPDTGVQGTGVQSIGAQGAGAQNASTAKREVRKPKHYHWEKYKRYARSKGARQLSEFKHGLTKLPGNAIKFSGKAAGAAIGAVGGAAIGIAQGDFGKATSGVTAGGALGGSIGGGLVSGYANKSDNALSQYYKETPEQAYQKAYNSKKHKDLAQYEDYAGKKQEMQALLKQEGITKRKDKEQFEQMMGGTDENGNKTRGLFDEMYDEDISDVKRMRAVQQMLNNNEISSVKDGIALAKTSKAMAKDEQADGINKHKYVKARERVLKKKGFSDDDAKIAAEKSIDMEIKFNKRLKDI